MLVFMTDRLATERAADVTALECDWIDCYVETIRLRLRMADVRRELGSHQATADSESRTYRRVE